MDRTENFFFCVLRTSSKESRIDEYLATESLAAFTPEEAKEFDEAVEGVYFKSFVGRNIRPPAQA